MKRRPFHSKPHQRRRGVALLIVLIGLAVLTIVIVAFLANGLTEVKSAKIYSDGSNVKLLSQTAVNLVVGEIKDSTSGQDPNGTLVAWASQPGMIRTFRPSDVSPACDYYYKLYSSGTMIGTGTVTPATDFNAMQYWYNNPAYYTDLNSPVKVTDSSGNSFNHYPILPGDINGTQMAAYTTPKDYTGTSYNALTYGSATAPDIQGFWVLKPGQSNSLPTAATTSNPVPMPVQWLYVLQNGTVVAPSSGAPTSGAQVNTVTIAGASASNPIVGRIAFWTDDESSKVNINTASEGTYVDTPRVATVPEVNLGNYQPAQHEFQRYPGHPAMTALSTVLGAWLPLPAGTTQNAYAGITAANFKTYLEPYYDLTPKIVPGDNKWGEGTGSMGATTVATGTLNLSDTQRSPLYDSVDELIFSSTRGSNPPTGSSAPPTLTRANLEEAKFFLTAHSRSPDVNLFNEPRVGIWPVSTVAASQSILDQLIAFCTTINKNIFYFQRTDYSSPTTDISITRNQSLLAYLKSFCGRPVPGFGSGAFRAKYYITNPNPTPGSSATTEGTDLDQIFTEIFDYVRCTNLHDTSSNSAGNAVTPYAQNPTPIANRTSANEVVPSYDATTDTKGFGRFLTVSQASMLFISTADGDWNNNPANTQFYVGTNGSVPATPAAGHETVQAAFLLDLFDPAMGYPQMTPDWKNYSITVTGLNNFTWSAGSMGFPASQFEAPSVYSFAPDREYGGSWGVFPLMCMIGTPTSIPSGTGSSYDPNNYGPPVSTPADFPKSSGTFSFGGGTGTVTIAYKGKTIQTINLNFPSATLPLPKLVNSDLTPTGTVTTYTGEATNAKYEMWSVPSSTGTTTPSPTPFPWIVPMNTGATLLLDYSKLNNLSGSTSGRFNVLGNFVGFAGNLAAGWYPALSVITPYDTVVSVINTSGDIRLSAAKSYIPSSDPVFSPHPLYQTGPMAHSLISADGTPLFGATRGSLAHLPNIATSSPYTTGYLCNTPYLWPVSSYQQYYAPPGAVPFPAAQSPPGVTASGSNSNTSIMPYYISGGTTPFFTVPNATSPVNGRFNTTAYTLEPEVRSTDGVVSGYVPTTPTTSTTDWANSPGTSKVPGDWDNGMGNIKDGAYINKPDEGTGYYYTTQSPYFNFGGAGSQITATFFSPNREIPSAVMFGSLPTGVFANRPWQTLLFHPEYTGNHVGNSGVGENGSALTGAPPDHLLLDLFTMPVVEPYAISEPLSTAGRINMNYQILPFTYINRDTGLRAVMKSERILSIPNGDSGGPYSSTTTPTAGPYKSVYSGTLAGGATGSGVNSTSYITKDLRFDINASETLKGFQARFGNNDIFRSPSEICTLDLIPQDDLTDGNTSNAPAYGAMQAYWADHALTGDNSRERPYADIYPRLTTKSNTFTIHMRVQTLQQTNPDLTNQPTIWTEGTDVITGEYRGSETVERYVDPNNPINSINPSITFPDYASASYTTGGATPPLLSSYYKIRVVSTKQFAP